MKYYIDYNFVSYCHLINDHFLHIQFLCNKDHYTILYRYLFCYLSLTIHIQAQMKNFKVLITLLHNLRKNMLGKVALNVVEQ